MKGHITTCAKPPESANERVNLSNKPEIPVGGDGNKLRAISPHIWWCVQSNAIAMHECAGDRTSNARDDPLKMICIHSHRGKLII